jgi:hypothetical protein
MMLAFIGSLAIAAAVGWLVGALVFLATLGSRGLEAIPGAMVAAVTCSVLTGAAVMWMLAQ